MPALVTREPGSAQAHPLRIGISARLLHQPPAELGFRNKSLQYIEQSIAHWLLAHGALAFMIPTIEAHGGVKRSAISVAAYVAALDGLLLQGGADVAPQTYGETPLRPEWAGDRVRDLYEIELFWEFLARGKPVLGICRGCQLINVACGGSLLQDISAQLDNAIPHVDSELYDAHRHAIELDPEGELVRLYPGLQRAQVNSIHHQAVARLGRDLKVEARAWPDGIVEAIRWAGGSFVAGFQWHPEFHREPELLDSTPILLDFLAAAELARG